MGKKIKTEKKWEKNKNKKKKKKRRREKKIGKRKTAQRFIVNLHSETLNNFSFFLIYIYIQ